MCDSKGCDVFCIGSKMKDFGGNRPGSSPIRNDTLKIADAHICFLEKRHRVTPRIFWRPVLQEIIYKPSKHDVANKKKVHLHLPGIFLFRLAERPDCRGRFIRGLALALRWHRGTGSL